MTWKNILVHIEAMPDKEGPMTMASALAKTFGARLTGLYRAEAIDPRIFLDPAMGAHNLDEFEQRSREDEATAQANFTRAVEEAGLESEWRVSRGHLAPPLSEHAHYADLVVTGQIDREGGAVITEELLLESGRPTLVVPQVGVRAPEIRRVMIAWTETREAARAVHDALPLLLQAEEVHVLCIARAEDEVVKAERASERLATYLGAHQAKTQAHHQLDRELTVPEAILSRAADLQIDAIVMGAYGHSKLREFVLGGATRGLMEHMTVPVLMAH